MHFLNLKTSISGSGIRILNGCIIFPAPMPSLNEAGHPQKLPYQIQIMREIILDDGVNIVHHCGAVLVSPKFVLTARYCIFDGLDEDRIINHAQFSPRKGGRWEFS